MPFLVGGDDAVIMKGPRSTNVKIDEAGKKLVKS